MKNLKNINKNENNNYYPDNYNNNINKTNE